MAKSSRDAGFTLIELGIVLAVVAVLMTSGIYALQGVRDNARLRRTAEELGEMANATRTIAARGMKFESTCTNDSPCTTAVPIKTFGGVVLPAAGLCFDVSDSKWGGAASPVGTPVAELFPADATTPGGNTTNRGRNVFSRPYAVCVQQRTVIAATCIPGARPAALMDQPVEACPAGFTCAGGESCVAVSKPVLPPNLTGLAYSYKYLYWFNAADVPATYSLVPPAPDCNTAADCEDGTWCKVDTCDAAKKCQQSDRCPPDKKCLEALKMCGCKDHSDCGDTKCNPIKCENSECVRKATPCDPLKEWCDEANGGKCMCVDDDACSNGKYCDGAEKCNRTTGKCDDVADVVCPNPDGKGWLKCDDNAGRCVCKQSACDDGFDCTYNDTCNADSGGCAGTALTCTNDANTCGAQRTCDNKPECKVTYPGPGTSCDDGEACTYGEKCSGGSCGGGTRITCSDDASVCGADRKCNGTSSCAVTYPSGSTTCDDGDPCTYNDRCNGSGGCRGTALSCTSDACATRTCNGSNTCTVSYKGATTACNDGNLCTYGDHCSGAGSCVGTSITCTSDAGQCGTQRTCNGTAACTESAASSCDDGDPCTYNDRCSGGVCAGTRLSCTNDGGLCGGVRSCNGTASCSVTYPGAWQGCNDGNACTYSDHCNGAGSCTGYAVNCSNDGSACGAQRSCNGTSSCDVTYPNASTGCNDGDLCTYADSCNGAGSCAGTRISCGGAGAGVCGTSSVCNGTNQCAVTTSAGNACDDGNACTYGDTCGATAGSCVGKAYACPGASGCLGPAECDGRGGCAAMPRPASWACNDGNACTYDDHCSGSGDSCSGTAYTCTSDTCTDRVCNGRAGCTETAKSTASVPSQTYSISCAAIAGSGWNPDTEATEGTATYQVETNPCNGNFNGVINPSVSCSRPNPGTCVCYQSCTNFTDEPTGFPTCSDGGVWKVESSCAAGFTPASSGQCIVSSSGTCFPSCSCTCVR